MKKLNLEKIILGTTCTLLVLSFVLIGTKPVAAGGGGMTIYGKPATKPIDPTTTSVSKSSNSITVTSKNIPTMAYEPIWGPYGSQWKNTTVFNDVTSKPTSISFTNIPSPSGVSVTTSYNAGVYNNSTNSPINAGSTITVGTVIRFTPSTGTLSWHDPRSNYSTLNGYWYANAAFPDGPTGLKYTSAYKANGRTAQCRSQYFAHDFNNRHVYIPLTMNPAGMTVNHSGTAGLSCNGDKTVCTVTSPGTISTTFTFASTYGKFYYEEKGYNLVIDNNVCHTPYSLKPLVMCVGEAASPNCSDYTLKIPAQTLSYSLTAVSANRPPNAPTIGNVSSNSYITNTSQSFTINATDPDNDNIRYGIDWDMNGSIDEWVPGSGYVPTGSTQNASRTWTTTGAKTFRALTEDSNGSRSGFTNHSVTLNQPMPPTATLEVNDQTAGNSWTGNDINLQAGHQIALRWTSAYANNCSGSNFSTSNLTNGTQTNVTEPILGQSMLYVLSCVGNYGNAYDQIRVTAVGIPPDISASTDIIRPGYPFVISWNTNDAEPSVCTVRGPGINLSLSSKTGSQNVSINNESTFTIDCGVSGKDEVTVKILPTLEES